LTEFNLFDHAKSLADFSRSPDEFIVKDIVDPQTCNLIYAPSGGMKSLYCLALAASISQGKPFLGQPSKQTNVLYLDGEMSEDSIARRVELMGIADIPKDCFTYVATALIMGYEANLADEKQREEYLTQIIDSNYKVVVLDNIRTLCQLINENDSSQFTDFNSWIKRLRGQGITVIVVHHSNKSKEDGTRAAYAGSSNISTVFESIVCLEKHEDGSLALHVDKDRNDSTREFLDGTNIRLNTDGEFELITDEMIAGDYYQVHLNRAQEVLAQIKEHPTDCKQVLKHTRSKGYIVEANSESWEKLYNNVLSDYCDFDTYANFSSHRKEISKNKRENNPTPF
jgi:RecA-family ATPase